MAMFVKSVFLCLFVGLATTGLADDLTLFKKLQGKWAKANYPLMFEVNGNSWVEYNEANPFKPCNSGEITYPRDKDYAIVKARSGHTLWLFSAGKNVIAVETFTPNGDIEENGRIFYRNGTVTP